MHVSSIRARNQHTEQRSTAQEKGKGIISSQPQHYVGEELIDCCRKDGDDGTA